MKKIPKHAACCFGATVLCLIVAFDLLLVRAVVIESDFQHEGYCQFNPASGACR